MLPIPGTSSIEHLAQNVAAAFLRLPDEDFQMLSRVPELVASPRRVVMDDRHCCLNFALPDGSGSKHMLRPLIPGRV
jgi:hypothetical protein